MEASPSLSEKFRSLWQKDLFLVGTIKFTSHGWFRREPTAHSFRQTICSRSTWCSSDDLREDHWKELWRSRPGHCSDGECPDRKGAERPRRVISPLDGLRLKQPPPKEPPVPPPPEIWEEKARLNDEGPGGCCFGSCWQLKSPIQIGRLPGYRADPDRTDATSSLVW